MLQNVKRKTFYLVLHFFFFKFLFDLNTYIFQLNSCTQFIGIMLYSLKIKTLQIFFGFGQNRFAVILSSNTQAVRIFFVLLPCPYTIQLVSILTSRRARIYPLVSNFTMQCSTCLQLVLEASFTYGPRHLRCAAGVESFKPKRSVDKQETDTMVKSF